MIVLHWKEADVNRGDRVGTKILLSVVSRLLEKVRRETARLQGCREHIGRLGHQQGLLTTPRTPARERETKAAEPEETMTTRTLRSSRMMDNTRGLPSNAPSWQEVLLQSFPQG